MLSIERFWVLQGTVCVQMVTAGTEDNNYEEGFGQANDLVQATERQ